ncbi:hypothetical protein [Seonamhaeicola sp.]|uniref:hypothetical protein n=1 Tax=Seonamhaeicola sp. TaxID=1912245 RepID=UPI002607469F|nr:hypothetical protein [Seonamhaeicola sp.]
MRNKNYLLILLLVIGLFYGLNSCKDKNRHSIVSPVSKEAVLSPKLLNSERIKMAFGSYGIDVLKKNSKLRVSNLYSLHDDKKITRTFAVVRYPERIDSMFLKEHTKILDGESIGRVFKEGQWKIEKQPFLFGAISASPDYVKVYNLMGHIMPSELAIYIYGFNVKKGDKSYHYATISEVYHPDYLTLTDLKTIYPDAKNYLNNASFTQTLNQVKKEMKAN